MVLEVLKTQDEEFICSWTAKQDKDADQAGMEHLLRPDNALHALRVLDVEERGSVELPRGAVYGFDLNWYCYPSFVCDQQIEVRNIAGKRCGNETHATQLGSNQVLTDLPR